jgi:glc operon protein GlcG
MFQQLSIGLDDAQRAIEAALAEARKDGRPMAAAVVDANGHLIACARMDGAHERVLRFAIRKAYTAAIMGRDTVGFKGELLERSRTLDDYGDPLFTTLQGGIPVILDKQVIGGISVGGNTQERDKGIAEIAVRALVDGLSAERTQA